MREEASSTSKEASGSSKTLEDGASPREEVLSDEGVTSTKVRTTHKEEEKPVMTESERRYEEIRKQRVRRIVCRPKLEDVAYSSACIPARQEGPQGGDEVAQGQSIRVQQQAREHERASRPAQGELSVLVQCQLWLLIDTALQIGPG